MRIMLYCPICPPKKIQEVTAEIDDNFLATISCDNGHKSIVYLKKHRFDILLDSGVLAFLSGFHSESVLSIAASLERLYELFIYSVLKKKGIPLKKIEETWIDLRRQSERQLGAFCITYILETRKRYKPNTQLVEFRNKVIHQGYIPKRNEVENYASKVVDIIFDIVTILRKDYEEEMGQIKSYNSENANKVLKEMKKSEKSLSNAPVLTLFTPSIVGMDESDQLFKRRTFDILLQEMREIKTRWGVT